MEKRTLSQLSEMVGGTLFGDGDRIIEGVAPIQSAASSDLTFLEKASRVNLLDNCQAGAVIVPPGVRLDRFSMIQVEDVLGAFKQVVEHFSPPRDESVRGISPQAAVDGSVILGENVGIGPFAVIEEDVILGDDVQIHAGVQIRAGCKIGSGTSVFANAVLYRNTLVGEHCIIHSGAVIGAFGFGYDSSKGTHVLSPQLGNVVIGDNVEIGSCTTIDRATYGSTIIGEGTKIDNLVMVGHNCKLGKYNLICAHTGIAGSTTTGDYVVMAGRVGIKDHVHIGEKAVLGAMAGILSSIPDGARVVGIPATPEKEQMRIQIAIQRLPEMRKEFKKLMQDVEELKKRNQEQ